MVLLFIVLFVVCVVFCLGFVVYALAFVLMRRDIAFKPLTKFTTNHYYDYPFFKRNESVFTNRCQQFLHR